MPTIRLFHKILKGKLPLINKTRMANLFIAVGALIKCSKLSLTGLGRNIDGTNTTRSNIKKIDRLLGNSHLQKEVPLFYKAISSMVVVAQSSPWIQVDWTCICSITNLYILRASLSAKGRSIVLYEEVHPKKHENNPKVHGSFLDRVKSILPVTTKPIIITDAGFRAPWFEAVTALGWDFVGRLRNKNLVKLMGSSTWQLSSNLYHHATSNPRYLGRGLLTEKKQVLCSFVVYKEKRNHGQRYRNKLKGDSTMIKRYTRAHHEPWLLVTSIKKAFGIAKKIVKKYKTRMQIEENIRDTKSARYGFSLRECRSCSCERVNILLLIATIATLICWLAGLHTKIHGREKDFQTQSSSFTGNLSIVFLGREALKRGLKMMKQHFTIAQEFLLSITAWQHAHEY